MGRRVLLVEPRTTAFRLICFRRVIHLPDAHPYGKAPPSSTSAERRPTPPLRMVGRPRLNPIRAADATAADVRPRRAESRETHKVSLQARHGPRRQARVSRSRSSPGPIAAVVARLPEPTPANRLYHPRRRFCTTGLVDEPSRRAPPGPRWRRARTAFLQPRSWSFGNGDLADLENARWWRPATAREASFPGRR